MASIASNSLLSSASSLKLNCFSKPSSLSVNFQFAPSTPKTSLKSSISNFPLLSSKKFRFQLYSVVEEITVQETKDDEILEEEENKKKLYVVNIPWTVSVADMKSLFGECGTVTDVEIIKQRDGRNRGFAFITMSTGEEARAVIDKFNEYEISGRVIRVEFSKRLKKPSPPPPPGLGVKETRHLLYVSNLAWKARASHLRELFSTCSSPVSARVVFDSPSGRSAGYGFVSFATREEAESALSALDGKELMGRPIRLKFSEKSTGQIVSEPKEDNAEPEEAEDTIDKPDEL
ncbi:hypothetical protein MKW98_024905 [Papaver atlanticum]|uniref:RRM domain-containing protein n=1 Tax=Papaver atlanticum TaxID=357466 RepID=A0AAD4T6R3_9MAGN|nr:hypothetical protein MKW98_024905 [Papaver atlanticum]